MRPALVRIRRDFLRLVLAAAATLALPAHAAFHLWTISEAFSRMETAPPTALSPSRPTSEPRSPL